MVTIVGIVAVIVVLVGVLAILGTPTVLGWIFQWRFSRRFERLVRQGRVIPILARNPGEEKRDRSRLTKRVTVESLVNAWIGEAHAQPPARPSSARGWKPLTASFISHRDERPVTSAILTTGAQKKEAKHFLETFRYQRGAVGASDALQQTKEAQMVSEEMPRTVLPDSEAAHTAGKLQFSALILMPSKLHPRYRTEAGKIISNTASSELPSGLYSRTLAKKSGNPHEREGGSDGIPRGMETLSAMEIGVSEHNLDQASDILELVGDDDGTLGDDNNRASVVSFGEEDEFNEMIRALIAQAPVARYPIMYGSRPYVTTRPMYLNPLLPARTRVY